MVIERLTHDFSICKLKSLSGKELQGEFAFAARTDQEYSLVCLSADVPPDALCCEGGWKAFRIQGVLDFALTGILAPIAQLLAAQKIGIFAVSTFNTDYVLVKGEAFDAAMDLLRDAGYIIQ